MTITLFFLFPLLCSNVLSYSIYTNIKQSETLTGYVIHLNAKRLVTSNRCKKNVEFSRLMFYCTFSCLLPSSVVIILLILKSGDVHPNPGPPPSESSDSCSSSFDLYNFLNLPNHLSTIHYNVQSIANKLDTLIAEFSYFDIMSFSETWLHNEVSSNELLFPSFHPPERKDPADNRYGGVILYVRNNLSYIRRHDLELNRLECIWIQIKSSNKRNILYGVFYRPPTSDSVYTSLIEDSIGLAIDSNISDVIITGDFNLNIMNQTQFRKVEALCNQFNMIQCIDEPTHFTENSHSIIDLLFVTNKDSILTTGVGEPCLDLTMRYHCPVFGVFNFLKPKAKNIQRTIWKYDQGNYNQLRHNFSIFDWSSVHNSNIDIYADSLADVITENACKFIPSKKVYVNPKEPPWLTCEIKKKIRRRKRLYRKAKKSNDVSHWSNFRSARNEVIALIRQNKAQYFERLASQLKSGTLSSRGWWKTLKSLMCPHSSTSIPPLYDTANDSMIIKEDEKANSLNSYFANQSCIDDSLSFIPAENQEFTNNSLDSINVTPSEVLDVLKTLKLGKASGPDGINNRILIEAAGQLAPHLCDLFNQSLNTSSVPSSWKISNVCPIYKSGDASLPSNYRPVSLLSNIEKVLERIIFKHVYNFLKDTDFFTPWQSGFMPGDSTVNQVACLYNHICKALDDGLEVRVLFFDISKAFDKVWHEGLLFKLKRAGIRGKLLSWFSSYLSAHYQRVILPGGVSALSLVQA